MREFFINNRKKVISSLKEDRAIVILFADRARVKSCDQFFTFVPNRNFYYMTGIDKPEIIFMAIKNGEQIEETLFIERYDELKAKWDGKTISEDEVKEISGIENIKYLDEFEKIYPSSIFKNNVESVYLDLENRYLNTHRVVFSFAENIRKNYPYITIKNIYENIAHFRMFKAPHEIDTMKKAISITKKGIESILNNARPNMKEYELEACFDYEVKRNGARDTAFNTILASGKNATVLHYSENNSHIEDNSLVLIDLGASYQYYSSDISRTFPVNGKFTERQKLFYNIVLEAQRKVLEAIKPEVQIKELNQIVIDHYSVALKEIGLIQSKEEVSRYYYHNVGHYIGLDTHDVFSEIGVSEGLKSGMVITVEPGLYIAEEGIGIRIEDDILVTEGGYENLSKDIIKTVEEIENFLSNRK